MRTRKDQGSLFDSFEMNPAKEKISGVPYAHEVRIVVRAEKGKILNGIVSSADEKARIFHFSATDVGRTTLTVDYEPPGEADRSDTIAVYNSCEVRYESVIPYTDTKKNAKLVEIENQCGWEGTLSMKESLAAGRRGRDGIAGTGDGV